MTDVPWSQGLVMLENRLGANHSSLQLSSRKGTEGTLLDTRTTDADVGHGSSQNAFRVTSVFQVDRKGISISMHE